MKTMGEQVRASYFTRQCFVCQKLGPCEHREYELEVAIIEREQRPKRKQPRAADSIETAPRKPLMMGKVREYG